MFMLKSINVFILTFFCCLAQAETPPTFNKERCDKVEGELINLQKIMLDEKAGGKETLQFAQAAHDKAMAELIILKGIKELKERHKKFLRDVTSPDGTKINGDLAKLNQFRGQLKDGVDVMGRMMVFQNMIDELIDLEQDWNNQGQKHQFEKKVRNDPKELKNLLVDRCANLEGGARAKVDQFPLCAVLSPPNSDDYEGLDKFEKNRIKAKVEALEGFSPNLDQMVEGFAKAYIVKHGQAADNKQAAQKRLEALEKYKKLLSEDFPEPLKPKNLYESSLRLNQSLLAAAGKKQAEEERDRSKKGKDILSKRVKSLEEIKKMTDLKLSIENGLANYEKCLGQLRMKTLANEKVEGPLNFQLFSKNRSGKDFTKKLSQLENRDTLPPLILDPEAKAEHRCELSLPQLHCRSIKIKKDHTCIKVQNKKVTMASAQDAIKQFQDKLKEDLDDGLNKYVAEIEKLNSSDGQSEGGERLKVGDAEADGNVSMEDLKEKSDALALSIDEADKEKQKSALESKLEIEKEALEKGALSDKQYFQNQFKGYLSSLNLFNDRAAMMANVRGDDPKKHQMTAKKTFLKALKGAGCLERDYDLNVDIGLENAAKEAFSDSQNPEKAGGTDYFKVNSGKVKGVDSYQQAGAQVSLNQKVLEKCFEGENLDKKVSELETEVMSKKNQIDKIKSSEKYARLNELKAHHFLRYKRLCQNNGNGFKTLGRCRIDYDSSSSGTESLETFISHNGKVLGVMALTELKKLPTYYEDKRKATKRMVDACKEHSDVLPEMCIDAGNQHHNAMLKTPNEKERELHEKYHITYSEDGKKQVERRKSTGSMVGEELARGIVQYGVPTWAQYEMNKSQMEYNEALGYNMKINNYLLEHPGTYIPGFGGYGYDMYGYSGFYPFASFGGGFYASPFLSSPVAAGSFQYSYLSAQ